ncbi:unnamed protein product [Amoebophrya sp. A25]|nr:unnamed protein product [Amoebophrya sp. A25]|eukprot:GSA25T00019755001.1
MRGTVSGLVTLTDDLGKAFAPIVVAHYMQVIGKSNAIGRALDCFLLSAVLNLLTYFTKADDFIHSEDYILYSNNGADDELGGGDIRVSGGSADLVDVPGRGEFFGRKRDAVLD